MQAFEKGYARLFEKANPKRPKLEQRQLTIPRVKRDLLLLLEGGIDLASIKDRLLELDQEERANQEELEITPEIEMIDHEEAMNIYREAITGALSQAYESNYAYDLLP